MERVEIKMKRAVAVTMWVLNRVDFTVHRGSTVLSEEGPDGEAMRR